MAIKCGIRPRGLGIAALAVLAVFTFFILRPGISESLWRVPLSSHSSYRDAFVKMLPGASRTSPHSQKLLSAPGDYSTTAPSLEICDDYFGMEHLYKYARNAALYTTPRSPVSLSCLRRPSLREAGTTDSFCVSGAAELRSSNEGKPQFRVNCELEDQPMDGTELLPKLEDFPEYMFWTGIPYLLSEKHVDLGAKDAHTAVGSNDPVAIIIRREASHNYWHSMQEFISTFNVLDILRMARSPVDGEALLSEDDLRTAQIVIVDELEDGPYFDLWDMLAQGPVLRAHEIEPGTRFKNIVLPLAGHASPFWAGNWDVFPCDNSPTLATFRMRVLRHIFGNSTSQPRDPSKPLVLTYIDRTGKRMLTTKNDGLRELAAKHPDVNMNRVDFDGMSFAEQLRIVSDTDILVGVHGAGMMHTLFLPPGSTVVEIIPESTPVVVYRNLAKLAGHRYFGTHAKMVNIPDDKGDFAWQFADVDLDVARFVELVDGAIRSMYNRGMINRDIFPVAS